MLAASRTPEGWPNQCPICGHSVHIEPSSSPTLDAPCPRCGHLLTFADPPLDWASIVKKFSLAVRMVPNNLMYRQCLRGCERKIYNDNKTGASRSLSRIARIRERIQKAREAENWVDLDSTAEEGLAINPWDGQFNADVGDAARERGFMEVAQFAYEQATGPDGCPKDTNFLIALANIYLHQNNLEAANAIRERIQESEPPI